MSDRHMMNPRSGSSVLLPPSRSTVPNDDDTDNTMNVGNKNISRQKEDVLYHLGLSNFSHDLPAMFGDVKFVCMGGSAVRVEKFAHQLGNRLGIDIPTGMNLSPIGKTERFSLFKIGPIISVNHGMGMPSMSILLHEITKLLYHAKVKDVNFMRIGTSGGVGVNGGTVVVTTEGVNGKLESCYEHLIMGKVIKRPTSLDEGLSTLAVKLASGNDGKEPIACVKGKTIGTDDFYEGQARLDGAEVDYEAEDRIKWLQQAYDCGVRNIEMESTCFAAWCHRTGIPGMICCAVLLNRLEGDQVTASPEELQQYSKNAQEVALRVIEYKLNTTNTTN